MGSNEDEARIQDIEQRLQQIDEDRRALWNELVPIQRQLDNPAREPETRRATLADFNRVVRQLAATGEEEAQLRDELAQIES